MTIKFAIKVLERELAVLDRRENTQRAFGSEYVVVNKDGEIMTVNGTPRSGLTNFGVSCAAYMIITSPTFAAKMSAALEGSRVVPASEALAHYRADLHEAIRRLHEIRQNIEYIEMIDTNP